MFQLVAVICCARAPLLVKKKKKIRGLQGGRQGDSKVNFQIKICYFFGQSDF
jgi:hypothetical protein